MTFKELAQLIAEETIEKDTYKVVIYTDNSIHVAIIDNRFELKQLILNKKDHYKLIFKNEYTFKQIIPGSNTYKLNYYSTNLVELFDFIFEDFIKGDSNLIKNLKEEIFNRAHTEKKYRPFLVAFEEVLQKYRNQAIQDIGYSDTENGDIL